MSSSSASMPLSPAEAGTAPAPVVHRPTPPAGEARREPGLTDRTLGWLLLVGGLLGLAAAFVLAVEKYALLADPAYVPTCSLNPVLSCGSVMSSLQAEVFGFLRAHGAVDLLRAFASIEDDQLRREVLAIVRSAARLGRKKDPEVVVDAVETRPT